MAGILDDRPALRGFSSHEEGKADHALVSHDGDFRRLTVFHYIEQRDYAVDWKIGVTHRVTRLTQYLA